LAAIPEAVSPGRAQPSFATVEDGAISEGDIEQRVKLDLLITHKQSARQDVIKKLIDDKKRIEEAEKYGVGPTNADINDAYAKMCTRLRVTPEQLTKSLEDRGIHPDELKQSIKASRVVLSKFPSL
jgi:peptidyl-prolyl cis-trans isomerase SurA